jgi:hypothetical protein
MNDLLKFIENTWKDEDKDVFTYRVYMAQKCLNLNESYYKQGLSSKDPSIKKIRENTFISQYALLLKADELLEHYTTHGEFPRILIVDELFLSGHDFSSLMYRMLDVIFEAWQRKYGEIEDQQYWVIRDAFVRSVTYRVYARSKEGSLTDRSLPEIREKEEMTGSQWHKYMADVVDHLNKIENVENTSFAPTFWLDRSQYEDVFQPSNEYLLGWSNETWEYGGTQFTIWQKRVVGSEDGARFCLAFVCKEANCGQQMRVTPYAFWGKLPTSSLNELFQRLAAILRQQPSDHLGALAEICETPYRAALNSKIRCLYALICVLELHELTHMSITELKHDFDKVAQSFGTIERIRPALRELYDESSSQVRAQLRGAIYESMEDAPEFDAGTDRQEGSLDAVKKQDYLKEAEDYFIHVDYFERQQAQLYREEKRPFDPSSNFFYADGCFSRYVRQFSADCALETKIAVFILLAQRSVITLTISAQGEDIVYAKAGESTSIAAQYSELSLKKMAVYIPALIVMEKVCAQFQLTTENWAAWFGSFLEKKEGKKGLGALFREFVSGVYKDGTKIEDYAYIQASAQDEREGDLYRQQVYYQEQVAVFFRES